MTCRWWSACLGAVSLVGILGVLSPAAAKPPDLPLEEKITVSDVVVEVYDGCVQIFLPDPAQSPGMAGMPLFPFAGTKPSTFWEKLHPAERRNLAVSLLFGIHPLLGLFPTEEMVDLPGDHPLPFRGMVWESAAPEPPENSAAEPLPLPKVWQEGPPGTTQEPSTTCPWLRQQEMERNTTRHVEIDWTTDDVLGNLHKLRKADELVEKSLEHAARGEVVVALDCLLQAMKLSPGSRVEGKAVSALTKLVTKLLDDRKDPSGDASEESEVPTSGATDPLRAEIEVGPDGVRMHCQFQAAGCLHEIKFDRGSFTWTVRARP